MYRLQLFSDNRNVVVMIETSLRCLVGLVLAYWPIGVEA